MLWHHYEFINFLFFLLLYSGISENLEGSFGKHSIFSLQEEIQFLAFISKNLTLVFFFIMRRCKRYNYLLMIGNTFQNM